MSFDSDYGGFAGESSNSSSNTVTLVDAPVIDLANARNILASSAAARTFTISYTGNSIIIEVTLSAISAIYTFPAAALCVSEGVASGNNTCGLSGVSGDKYIITIEEIDNAYYVIVKNFGQ
jgi:hypothetical protein